MPSSISPKITFQRVSGEIQFYNNLIYVQQGGSPIQTFLSNQGVQYDIGNNLFYPQSVFNLDQRLTSNALYTDPKLQQPGADWASMYKLLSGSSAKYAGAVIAGSYDQLNYSQNNGGLDFFGNVVSDTLPPHIGAYNTNELLAAYSETVEIPVLIFPLTIMLAALLMTIALHFKRGHWA